MKNNSNYQGNFQREVGRPRYNEVDHLISATARKMKFFIKGFFSKCDQIRSFQRIWSHLLKKFLMKNFTFDAVCIEQTYTKFRKQLDERQGIKETLLKNIQNCSYDNIVVNGSHKVDKVSFEDPKSPH